MGFSNDSVNSVAVEWFRRWLQRDDDPVEALQHVLVEHHKNSAEMASWCSIGNYRDWQTDKPVESLQERFSHLLIDREKQKSMAAKWLAEFVSSDSLRVMVLVPYAGTGNRLDLLHEQLRDHCEFQLSDKLAISIKPLQFPASREDLCRNLEYELNTQLEATPGEPLQHLLRRNSPRTSGATRSVLWLNWGLFGNSNPPLKPSELEAWLNFAAGYLTRHCPADLRIVCYAAIEVEQSRHAKLKRSLLDHHRRFVEPSFWLRILEPLDNVEEHELLDFLKDKAKLASPDAIGELAQRMIDVTGGRFEALLKLIQRAESESSWYDILHRLRQEQGAVPDIDDDAF